MDGEIARPKLNGAEFTCFVQGKPATKGSWKSFGGKKFVPETDRSKPWELDVKHTVIENYSYACHEGPMWVSLSYLFHRPATHFRTGRNAHLLRDAAPQYPCSKSRFDSDKLARVVMDALSGVVFCDDAQVVTLIVTKRYTSGADNEGVQIAVREILNDDVFLLESV